VTGQARHEVGESRASELAVIVSGTDTRLPPVEALATTTRDGLPVTPIVIEHPAGLE